MNCQGIVRQLSGFQDNELDADRRRRVQQHLDHCPGCRAQLLDLQRLQGRLLAEPPPADPFLPQRVMAALAALRAERARPAMRLRWLPASLYALVFLAVFFLGFTLRNTGGAAAPSLPAATYSAVLSEPQGLGLMAVHDATLGVFTGRQP